MEGGPDDARAAHDHHVLLARAETFVVAVVRSSIWGCLGSSSLLDNLGFVAALGTKTAVFRSGIGLGRHL